MSAPILTFPVYGKDFIKDTDANNEGIGAVLSQTNSNGEGKKLMPKLAEH